MKKDLSELAYQEGVKILKENPDLETNILVSQIWDEINEKHHVSHMELGEFFGDNMEKLLTKFNLAKLSGML